VLFGSEVVGIPRPETAFFLRHGHSEQLPVMGGQGFVPKRRAVQPCPFTPVFRDSGLGSSPHQRLLRLPPLVPPPPTSLPAQHSHQVKHLRTTRRFFGIPHTLSSLTFHVVLITWPAFVSIVDYFPNVRDLKVTDPTWEADHQQAPPLSRPLRGRLSIQMYQDQVLSAFADRFSGLEVEYDEILILGNLPTLHYQRIIDTCGKSLKRLRLGGCECTLQCFKITSWVSADTTL